MLSALASLVLASPLAAPFPSAPPSGLTAQAPELPAWCSDPKLKGTGRKVTETQGVAARWKRPSRTFVLGDFAPDPDLRGIGSTLGAPLAAEFRRGAQEQRMPSGTFYRRPLDPGKGIARLLVWRTDAKARVDMISLAEVRAAGEGEAAFRRRYAHVAAKLGAPGEVRREIQQDRGAIMAFWNWPDGGSVQVSYSPPASDGAPEIVGSGLIR